MLLVCYIKIIALWVQRWRWSILVVHSTWSYRSPLYFVLNNRLSSDFIPHLLNSSRYRIIEFHKFLHQIIFLLFEFLSWFFVLIFQYLIESASFLMIWWFDVVVRLLCLAWLLLKLLELVGDKPTTFFIFKRHQQIFLIIVLFLLGPIDHLWSYLMFIIVIIGSTHKFIKRLINFAILFFQSIFDLVFVFKSHA